MSFTYLSLFSGLGGLDLGLDRAGMTCVGQVEINPYARAVLGRHWPEVPKHDDVRTAGQWWLERGAPAVDAVAGGPNCQPHSRAGLQLGTADARWAWPWMFDVIRVARPRYVIVENVAALLGDREAFGWILRDLSLFGFDAEWSVVSACALGAPHTRERLFLVAYPNGLDGPSRLGRNRREAPLRTGDAGKGAWPDAVDGVVEATARGTRVADGLPEWLEPARVTALGNAVVPQVAEAIGRMVIEHSEMVTTSVGNTTPRAV